MDGAAKPAEPVEAEVDTIIDHAWDKHVVNEKEFPEVSSEEDLRDIIEETTEWGYREDGSVYWYDEVTNTVVVKNPPGVGGTIYRPGPGGS